MSTMVWQTHEMSGATGQGPIERVRNRVGPDVLRLLELKLTQSELTTLLLSVSATRAARVSPSQLLAATRFTQPAKSDPRALSALEHHLWGLLPGDFEGLELSPVAPLGVCAVMAGVSQNRVMSTVRGSEVVSDATNVLAVEAARRRKDGQPPAVHLAASHRLLRTQHFGGDASAHFRLFSLVSSTRDRGSGRAQADLVALHLEYWAEALKAILSPGLRWYVDYTIFRFGAVAERMHDELIPALSARGVSFRVLEARSGRDYYGDLAFKINVETPSGITEVGDGGLTRWTAQLMNDAKEHCLISCVATERLLSLTTS